MQNPVPSRPVVCKILSVKTLSSVADGVEPGCAARFRDVVFPLPNMKGEPVTMIPAGIELFDGLIGGSVAEAASCQSNLQPLSQAKKRAIRPRKE